MNLETDYLIVGSGAVGMAFADVLVTETDANIIIVDKYAKPGGHWNVAYPFVTLHQPSAFYGVSSKELSNGKKDEIGLNKGLHDLASGAEVSAYFDDVMKHQFLPSGRVQYFPMCEYKGNNKFTSMISGEQFEVTVRKKIVDCTYLNTSVPSTHTPNFTIAPEVQFMPLNDLPKIKTPPAGFVVIGGGKTGIDACLWLLENRVDPDKITWIISRDAWLLDRRNTQPTEEFFNNTIGAQAAQFESVAQATSIVDMFDRLEASGVLLRLDKSVRPSMFHGATISQKELKALHRIKNMVRKGRVQRIEEHKIIFKESTIPTSKDHIHIDCSATPIRADIKMIPIFKGNVITPQTVRPYQPVFSAAFIAHIEATYVEEKEKNNICGVVPLPNHDTDWIRMLMGMMMNQFNWSKDKEIGKWLLNNRLDGFSAMMKGVSKEDTEKQAIIKRMRNNAMPAMMKLQQFMQEINTTDQQVLTHSQFQVKKEMFFNGRLVETPKEELTIKEGEVLVKIDKFAFSANNITYAVAGDMLGYWQFFPPVGEDKDGWGIIPVWGFADVVESTLADIPVGDRLFGYFPPASHLKMEPIGISARRLVDGAEHRSKLPKGYNLYQRVNAEPGYTTALDKERALLFPLYLTSFCIWDALQDNSWYGAKQIMILSASSKTSIGLAYALKADKNAPHVIGVTSPRNLATVNERSLYDNTLTYDAVTKVDNSIPTVIVDMSGNSKVLLALHQHLGDNMKFTINVGITHWKDAAAKPKEGIITERSEFFFAPGHIQKRLKEWGPAGFDEKTSSFMMEAAAKTREWLSFRKVDGLEGMAAIHQAVCKGEIPADEGLIVEL